MRKLLPVMALVLAACSRADRSGPATRGAAPPSPPAETGPETIVLRIPRAGGAVRAYRWPMLDSAIWTSAASAPPLSRTIGFDMGEGSLAALDTAGRPVRIDLRLGEVSAPIKGKLALVATINGRDLFGVNPEGGVVRLTPSGEAWSAKPPGTVRALLPQRDGSLLALGDQHGAAQLWRWHPPRATMDGASDLPAVQFAVASAVGDRIWLVQEDGIQARRGKDLSDAGMVALTGPVRDAVPTPSGDRLYVATDGARGLVVVDRYRNDVTMTLALPSSARAVRMDPLGRFLLARPARGDSAWIVTTAAGQLVRSVGTPWRDDLPVIAPNGAVLAVKGDDVVVLEAPNFAVGPRIVGGAADLWIVVTWSGFRPRSIGLVGPPRFAGSDSGGDAVDSVIAASESMDSLELEAARAAGAAPAPVPPPSAPPSPGVATTPADGFLVSFASLVSEPRAAALANDIRLSGPDARVLVTPGGRGTTYRVVLGPFPTKAEAERAGKAAGRDYWIVENHP